MKKILTALMLLALFVSCSSDDNKDPLDNGGSNIDENIIGKWKVEYSKTIKGARFLEDGTLEVGKDSEVAEYMGNFGEPNIIPTSGIFNSKEIRIEIKNDNRIIVSAVLEDNKTAYYKIEDGLLKWIEKPIPGVEYTHPVKAEHKYKIKDNKLIIERIPSSKNNFWYTISEYSRIKE